MFDMHDALGFAGLSLTAAGLVFVFWPLALIVPGLCLMALAVTGARHQRSETAIGDPAEGS